LFVHDKPQRARPGPPAFLNSASAGAVRGGNPAEAFAKGGDSDELRVAPSLVSDRYNTPPALGRDNGEGHSGPMTFFTPDVPQSDASTCIVSMDPGVDSL
jgi:hypothetical protein